MEKAKQIPYRAIALDLDGTLTNHEKVVTPKTREALLKAASEGAVIILASGRPTYGIEPVAECLDIGTRRRRIMPCWDMPATKSSQRCQMTRM